LVLPQATLHRPRPRESRSPQESATDRWKNALHADQRTTVAWIFPASRGESPRQMAESVRKSRTASARFRRRGGSFGSAAPRSEVRLERRWVDLSRGGIAQTSRSARRELARVRRRKQGISELLVWRGSTYRYDARPPSAADRFCQCTISRFAASGRAAEIAAARLRSIPDAVCGRLCLRRAPISPIILSLSTDVGDSSDGWRKR
jgi:hypothetical protein